MNKNLSDNFFDSIDFNSILDTVKGIMTSDGSMSILLDFERCLDEADVYAFKNWLLGELVQGPIVKRYTTECTFMWPYKLMPDPTAAKRLVSLGCSVIYGKSEIAMPVKVENYDDFVSGTNYPKMKKRKVWYVQISIPKELMNDIKEGSIDLAGQDIDLQELSDSYDQDLDEEGVQQDESPEIAQPEIAMPPVA